MRNSVEILMSTYNGEEFLREQIESILHQRDVDIQLLVRDDGSNDSTIDILSEYESKGLLNYYKGENLKPAKSFLDLLNHSDDSDYYAFSDQDDFWKEEKIATAVESLKDYTAEPALYFSRTMLADRQLQPIGSVKINPKLTFGESLVYEFIGGCTMVFNKKLRNIVNRYNPEYVAMHDVWIYCVALAVGSKIVFDETPHILYRQHGDNVIGQGYGKIESWKRRIKRILIDNEQSRYRKACEIKRGFYDIMPEENKSLINDFIDSKHNIKKRMALLHDKRLECSDVSTWKRFRIAAILNTY